MHCVIGSGPAGVACASALLERGRSVRMLDGGIQLETERAQRVTKMRAQPVERWSKEDLDLVREGTSSSVGGVLLKRIYGSDFPYQEADRVLGLSLSGVGVKASLARGGFSSVWGAAMLPYADHDLVDWPFAADRLARHYRAVTAITGLSAEDDALAGMFPLYADRPEVLRPSRQATVLLDRWRANEGRLHDAGIRFGRSRLAVRGSAGPERRGCVHCGLCMYGCPYGLIYNSTATVERLRRNARFEYQPGFVVDSVREAGDGVSVNGREHPGGAASAFTCDRVYLAAGAIPTTQILLRSTAAFERAVHMLDSQYYLIPLLLPKSTGDVQAEGLHTLSQLFLEVRDRAISPYTVHLQVYTYNDLIEQAVRSAFGPLASLFGGLARRLSGRLVVLQGYLHSAHSATIRMELRRPSAGGRGKLEVTAEQRPETRRVVRKVLAKLLRNSTRLGALPLTPLAKVEAPGRGFHTGGTFPMRPSPGPLECDVLGRPYGWTRIHAVDATVLPSIAATTITLTVMANAHRIGWESEDL